MRKKTLQLADNGLPFPKKVKDSRDLIVLMREMGIRWHDPSSYGVPFLSEVLWYIDGHHDTILADEFRPSFKQHTQSAKSVL